MMNLQNHRPGKHQLSRRGGCYCKCCLPKSSKELVPNNPDNGKKRVKVATTIVNLLLYLLYITIVCTVTFGVSTLNTYGLTKVILHHFVDAPFKGYGGQLTTFRKSSTINDFWLFAENVVIPNFYRTDEPFPTPFLANEIDTKAGLEDDNHLAGGARFRQIRVVRNTCPIFKTFPLLSRICFPKYSKSKEESKKFNVGVGQGGDHLDKSELHGTEYSGSVNRYGSAGYAVVLSKTRKDTQATIKRLKENLWISRATRAVFLEFILFNPNINVFSSVRLAWEIPSTGGVTTSWDIETVKLNQYSTPFENFVFGCEMAFFCFTVYYLIIEIITFSAMGCKKYFSTGWTYISIIITALSCFCVFYSFKRYFTLNKIVTTLSNTSQIFLDIDLLIQFEVWYKDLDALLIFLVWIKLFKYLAFNKSLYILQETISRCAKDFGGFGIIFLVVLLSFAELGQLVFGTQVLGFSTFSLSVFTLWGFILGKFDYKEVYNANRFFGPIFFSVFMIFVYLILINIFLAIINNSYHIVHACTDKEKNDIITSTDFIEALGCSKCCHNGSENSDVAQDVKEINIDPKEIKRHLKSKQFSDMEIEIFFDRFHVAENDTLDGGEAHTLLTDFSTNQTSGINPDKGRRASYLPYQNQFSKTLPQNKEKAEILEKAELKLMVERIGIIESAVVELVPKIDSMMNRIELSLSHHKLEELTITPKRRSLGQTTRFSF